MKDHRCGILVGPSPLAAKLREDVLVASRSPGPLLLEGEPGSGKESIASFIHSESAVAALPFEVVDCSRWFEDELEGVLFGQGTPAVYDQGILTREEGGTCCLLRGEEIPPRTQECLADYLDSQAPVRIMLSSPRDLAAFTRAGLYSRRLFDQVRDRVITVAPLRKRSRDLGRLIDHQVGVFETGSEKSVFSPDAYGALATYAWPGNYRQLEAELKVILRESSGSVELEKLPAEIASFWLGRAGASSQELETGFGVPAARCGEWGGGSVEPERDRRAR